MNDVHPYQRHFTLYDETVSITLFILNSLSRWIDSSLNHLGIILGSFVLPKVNWTSSSKLSDQIVIPGEQLLREVFIHIFGFRTIILGPLSFR